MRYIAARPVNAPVTTAEARRTGAYSISEPVFVMIIAAMSLSLIHI